MAEKYKEAFLEDLLLNNVKADVEIHNRARLYGWDFTQGALAAVVDINNIKRYFIDRLDSSTNRMLEQATEVIFKCSIREMQRTFPEARYFKQSDLIAFIISEPKSGRAELPARLEATFARLQKALAGVSPFTITLGVGNTMRISGRSPKATQKPAWPSTWAIRSTGLTAFCFTSGWACTGCWPR